MRARAPRRRNDLLKDVVGLPRPLERDHRIDRVNPLLALRNVVKLGHVLPLALTCCRDDRGPNQRECIVQHECLALRL